MKSMLMTDERARQLIYDLIDTAAADLHMAEKFPRGSERRPCDAA